MSTKLGVFEEAWPWPPPKSSSSVSSDAEAPPKSGYFQRNSPHPLLLLRSRSNYKRPLFVDASHPYKRSADVPLRAAAPSSTLTGSPKSCHFYRLTLPDVRARCRQIERYGKKALPPVPTPLVITANSLEGIPASYNTFVHAYLDPGDPSLVYFCAHSDAAHVRGLAASAPSDVCSRVSVFAEQRALCS